MTRWPVPHTGWAKLGWKGWGGGSHVPCPTLWSLHHSPPAQAPVLACKGRERQWRQPAPLYWAPCWTLERGKRRGRERPTSTHTKNPVYVHAEFDRECIFSKIHRVAHTDGQLDRTGQTRDMWVRWVQTLAHKSKLYNLHKMLSLFQEITLLKRWKI